MNSDLLLGVDIKDIPKVSDKDFSVTLNAYFIVKWKDPRIIVSDTRNKSVTGLVQLSFVMDLDFFFFESKVEHFTLEVKCYANSEWNPD